MLDFLIKYKAISIFTIMHRILYKILIFAIIIGFSGCGSSYEGNGFRDDSNRRSDSGKPDSTWIFPPPQTEELPPIKPEVPGFYVKEPKLEFEEYVPIVEETETPDSTEAENLETRIVAGYRIQIFAGRVQKMALAIKRDIESQVSVPVYLIYEAPQYKVRAGNFPERDEAMALCRQLRLKGFPGAWVVRSQIEVKM